MLFEREIQRQIRPWLNRREIIVILGSRQVGKTSLLKLIQQELKDEPIFTFDLEDTFNLTVCESVDSFIDYLSLKGLNKNRRNFCFIDEIQYHPDATKFLKLIHDHHPYLKLIVTGSSALKIRKNFKESLAGRKITFHLHPLSFLEYLRFNRSEFEAAKSHISLKTIISNFNVAKQHHLLSSKIIPLLENFIILGGYPKIAYEPNIDIQKQLLKEIYNTYIQKDIRDLVKIENILKFNKLITFLSVQNANLFHANEVAKEIGIARNTLENYLVTLENTFIVSQLRPFYKNLQKELTKMPKLYFMDNGLANVVINDFRNLSLRPDAGALFESTCYQEIFKSRSDFEIINFWRTTDGREVDFVITLEDKSIIPIEVKFKNFVKPVVPASLKHFIKTYQPDHAIVVTRNTLEKIELNNTIIFFVPLWMI